MTHNLMRSQIGSISSATYLAHHIVPVNPTSNTLDPHPSLIPPPKPLTHPSAIPPPKPFIHLQTLGRPHLRNPRPSPPTTGAGEERAAGDLDARLALFVVLVPLRSAGFGFNQDVSDSGQYFDSGLNRLSSRLALCVVLVPPRPAGLRFTQHAGTFRVQAGVVGSGLAPFRVGLNVCSICRSLASVFFRSWLISKC